MNAKTRARFEAKAGVVKAVAHPTRLFLVDELSRGERCVCELTGLVGADVSTVSKHLAILKNAGIVSCQKRGVQVFYRLETPCILDVFSCVESVARSAAEEQLTRAR